MQSQGHGRAQTLESNTNAANTDKGGGKATGENIRMVLISALNKTTWTLYLEKSFFSSSIFFLTMPPVLLQSQLAAVQTPALKVQVFMIS